MVTPPQIADWRNSRIEENLGDISGRRFVRENLHGSRITVMRGAVLEHCNMAEVQIEPKRLSDLLGVTMTIDCFSFEDLRMNELAMDAMLYLLAKTKGNDEKREVLKSLISAKNKHDFDLLFDRLENWGKRGL
jgi:hypothetical protein